MIDLTKEKMQTDELNSDTLQPNDLSDLDEIAIKEKTKTSNLFILITILTFTIIAITDITKSLLNPWKQINWMSCMTRIILGGALVSSGFGILLHIKG
jgi:hypothetical protein